MTTVIEENRNTLRPALLVECGFNETSDVPISVEPFGNLTEYAGLANMDQTAAPALMDLLGDGFLNDGTAQPMETDSDSYRYGYISEGAALPDGSFLTAFGVTIEAATNWSQVTLEITVNGVVQTVVYDNPVWISGKTTVYVEHITPGARAFITGVYLGKYWSWTNDNLISVNLDLRAVSTQIGGELEASSIEIKAYEPENVTPYIGFIPEGAPIWYSAGYPDDMSERRNFYMSEPITWEDNVLTVKGQDATMMLDSKTVATKVNYTNSSTAIASQIYGRVLDALDGIDYTTEGSRNSIFGPGQTTLYEEEPARTIISDYTNIFRNSDYVKMTYVDAGIPKLYYGTVGNSWTIYADEITELSTNAEQNINEIDTKVATYSYEYSSEVATIEATAGASYVVDLDPPLLTGGSNIRVTPTPTSLTVISPKTIRFIAASTEQYTVSGFPVYENLAAADDPYVVTDATKGIPYEFDNVIPEFLADSGSITKFCLQDMLDRANIVYTFTYRGNPHIQPRDTINVQIANWVTEQVVIDGLYPETDLYPAADLYPNARYKTVRRMVTEWVTMTVDNVTLEHSNGGGLTSKITARKGAV
ncbi:MAG: hypothetical protein IKG01_12280 [Lachnospiraceae bacterium]|nr:hypothetical protein [Lachnospiraceae bacterium]